MLMMFVAKENIRDIVFYDYVNNAKYIIHHKIKMP